MEILAWKNFKGSLKFPLKAYYFDRARNGLVEIGIGSEKELVSAAQKYTNLCLLDKKTAITFYLPPSVEKFWKVRIFDANAFKRRIFGKLVHSDLIDTWDILVDSFESGEYDSPEEYLNDLTTRDNIYEVQDKLDPNEKERLSHIDLRFKKLGVFQEKRFPLFGTPQQVKAFSKRFPRETFWWHYYSPKNWPKGL